MDELSHYVFKQKLAGIIIASVSAAILLAMLLIFLIVHSNGYIWFLIPLMVMSFGCILVGVAWYSMANRNKVLSYKYGDDLIKIFSAENQYIYVNNELLVLHKGVIHFGSFSLERAYNNKKIRAKFTSTGRIILMVDGVRLHPIKD